MSAIAVFYLVAYVLLGLTLGIRWVGRSVDFSVYKFSVVHAIIAFFIALLWPAIFVLFVWNKILKFLFA